MSAVITNPRQKLLVEALTTLPLFPRSSELTFLAYGIQKPTEDVIIQNMYLRTCEEQRVIPYSNLTFFYNHREETFELTSFKIPEQSPFSKSVYQLIAKGLLSGYKAYSLDIFFEREENSHKEQLIPAFPNFIKEISELFFANSYIIHKGKLIFVNNAQRKLFRKKVSLEHTILTLEEKELRLTLGNNTTSEESFTLGTWFEKLTEK